MVSAKSRWRLGGEGLTEDHLEVSQIRIRADALHSVMARDTHVHSRGWPCTGQQGTLVHDGPMPNTSVGPNQVNVAESDSSHSTHYVVDLWNMVQVCYMTNILVVTRTLTQAHI